MWILDVVLWLRDFVLNCLDCSIKVIKVDEIRGIVYVYLFIFKNFFDFYCSINCQIINVDLWKYQKDVFLSVIFSGVDFFNSKNGNMFMLGNIGENFRKNFIDVIKKFMVDYMSVFFIEELLFFVYLLKLGEYMDVYVFVVCYLGYFVIQFWQEIYKLEVLMEEMILYYSVFEECYIVVEKD